MNFCLNHNLDILIIIYDKDIFGRERERKISLHFPCYLTSSDCLVFSRLVHLGSFLLEKLAPASFG
ncbi:hypothetical protein BpHYR1_034305 [Brachionus plicatilis]|uniref:Uncharacterized protein n=1 Tax=Brachionus plicatilis TaxID=10195 RepID=A0A3M7RVF9_BRAPC|nr:hypothetical protein BpHYR1_034305 [Brachionus plicatilis]